MSGGIVGPRSAVTVAISLVRLPGAAVRGLGLLVAHAPTAARTRGIVADELDSGAIERLNDLHERVDDAPDVSFARFHPLDGRQGYTREFSERSLIDSEERTITAIDGNTLTLDAPLEHEHAVMDVPQGDLRGEVGNLSRNVVVTSADPATEYSRSCRMRSPSTWNVVCPSPVFSTSTANSSWSPKPHATVRRLMARRLVDHATATVAIRMSPTIGCRRSTHSLPALHPTSNPTAP